MKQTVAVLVVLVLSISGFLIMGPAEDADAGVFAPKVLYVDDDGRVIADHTEAKRLLDVVRAGSRPHDEPVADVTRVFNEATHEGADMSKYSALLTDAIHSMIDVTEERDIDSLFSGGHTTALTQQIAGLDDFELIAFIAVVDPEGAS